MREVRVAVEPDLVPQVIEIARRCGIETATAYEVYVHGPNERQTVVSVETSTPAAKRFVDDLGRAAFYSPRRCAITSRELRAIIGAESIAGVTEPTVQPLPDVEQELWQDSHITVPYLGRAFVAASLLSYGMIHDSALLMIGGLLFTPFLTHALAIAFGAVGRDWRLARQGLLALLVGGSVTFLAAAGIASLTDAPLRFDGFRPLQVSLLLSTAIGVAAGFATSDDAGRRPLIGLAAASQFAIYPAWFGIMAVRGFDGAGTSITRAETLAANILTIVVIAAFTYVALGMVRAKRVEQISRPSPFLRRIFG